MSLILQDLFNVSDFTRCDQCLILQDVISYGCGGDMMSEYKSLIYYHEDKPKWQETVKVTSCCLDLSDYKGDCLNLVKLSDCEGDCSHENLSHIYNTWLF